MFFIEWKTKFLLGVSENKVAIFSPIQVHRLLKCLPWFRGPQVKNGCLKGLTENIASGWEWHSMMDNILWRVGQIRTFRHLISQAQNLRI